MARVGPSFVLLLGCALLQHAFASPRPEFGSAGVVPSSNTIKTMVDTITPELNKVDDLVGLQLKTDYELLTVSLPLMEALGTKVSTLGPAITTNIISSIPKNDGNLNAAFNPIIAAIGAFKNFIDTQVVTTRATFKARLGDDIDHLFGDVFGNMKLAIIQLENALLRLKGALATATIQKGRVQIDTVFVTDVTTAAGFVLSTISPVKYTVQSTIENIGYADNFLYSLQTLTTLLKDSLDQYFTTYSTELKDKGEWLKIDATSLKDIWQQISNGVPAATSAMSSLPDYADITTTLSKFGEVSTTLQSIPAKIDEEIPKMLTIASTFTTDYANILVPRSYLSVTYAMEVLIAGGKYSRFCFFKYSPRLTNYYGQLVSDVEVCYLTESYRLDYIFDIVESVNQMIYFDMEDLLDNLTGCNTKAAPGPCIKAIGPYYVKLAEKTAAKLATLMSYTSAETKASLMRLGSCIVTNKLKNMQTLVAAVNDIRTCHETGPQDPN